MPKVSYVTIDVNQSIRPLSGQRDALVALRQKMGVGQVGFAEWLGVTQSQVAKWETGKRPVPYKVVLQLARGVSDPAQREVWCKLAGVHHEDIEPPSQNTGCEIPLLRDAAAAGAARTLNEKEVEEWIQLPRRLIPSSTACAIRVEGDSMSPILESGYLVIVDPTKRDGALLVNKMVLAREDDGCTIKWLRRDGGTYMLAPELPSSRHPIRVFKKERDLEIVGQITSWIGWPK